MLRTFTVRAFNRIKSPLAGGIDKRNLTVLLRFVQGFDERFVVGDIPLSKSVMPAFQVQGDKISHVIAHWEDAGPVGTLFRYVEEAITVPKAFIGWDMLWEALSIDGNVYEKLTSGLEPP